MAVRFILGRAGAGKTRTCIDQVQQHLRQSPRAGPKLILLVPDQASLQTERALLSAPDIAGAQRAEVLNFRRFAQRLLQTAPAASARPISNIGRVMVLQRLVGELRSELRYFQSDRLLPGLYRQLSTQIEEFIVGAISPDDLQSQAVADAGDESARAKLSDLALLYDRYLKFLSRGFVDPAMALEEARQHLPAAEWVRGAHIWIDGFARLSEQQARFLTDLAEHAERVEVALLVDPADDGVAGDNAPDPHALFGPTVRTYHKLLAAFAKRHIPIEPPLFLPQADTASGSTRGAERRDLKHLQAHIFGVGHADERPPENISLIEAADAEDEIRLVVRRITALASRGDDPVRYRDIAIITRQLAEHHSLIAAALQDNNIPYFVDRRPPLGEHAVSFFLRALVGVATERFSTQTVRQLLKSDLLNLDPAQADRLENYIIAHRIAGLKTWTGPDWHRDPRFRSPLDDPDESRDKQDLLRQINATRRAFVEQLAPWINTTEAGEPPPRPGAHWARVLYETIERLEVPQQIERWALAAEGDGQTAEANHHRQAWRCVVQLLDDFATALGDSPMSRQEFAQILDAGLGQLDTGLVPPAVDQVLVGSIERSRHPDIRIAFVLGMNDGVWPRIEREPQLLNDDDRRMLTQAGLAVDPPCVENIGEDRLLAYVALTRPRDRLYVSYCRTDLDGRPLEPSPYLDELRRLFPALLVEQSDRAGVAAQVDAIATGRALIHALADRLSGTQDRSKWNAVYDRARQRDDLRRPLAAALRSLIDCNESTLSSDLIDDLSRRPLRTSITQLENYSNCPFQHFAGGRLKLTERPTGELNALHLGALYHAVLDSFTQKLMDDKVQLRDLHDDQLNERLCDSISHFSKRFGDWVDEERGSQAFVWERLHYELLAALNAHRTIF
ncbi:MAG: exodeoxyribonuclease V subunit gamma, partial [Planctomycetes bacterium]|nr:exodeoxyribonuclease V subunit gamma [Planctomycetota bacterium]